MEKISDEVWKEILNRQNFPLIGTNEPNNGNGYHDAISWQIPFRNPVFKQNESVSDSFNTFRTVYLRDLSNDLQSGFQRKEKIVGELKITQCSNNYSNTFEKFISKGSYSRNDFVNELGEWGKYFAYKGRVIFEIIGWYDNNTNQFYGFDLRRLDTDYCKVTNNYVIYDAPFKQKGDKVINRKIKIPKEKCIVVDFPKEFGGYKGFIKKDQQILKLGNRFSFDINPQNLQKNFESSKEWERQYHKIISDWGTSAFTHIEDVSEFSKELNFFKYRYMVICCTHEIINGLKQLIEYLNKKLFENAEVEFNVKEYDKDYFKSMLNKYLTGELNLKEAVDFLKIYL